MPIRLSSKLLDWLMSRLRVWFCICAFCRPLLGGRGYLQKRSVLWLKFFPIKMPTLRERKDLFRFFWITFWVLCGSRQLVKFDNPVFAKSFVIRILQMANSVPLLDARKHA